MSFDYFATQGGDALASSDDTTKLARFHTKARAMERKLLDSLNPKFTWGVTMPLPPAAPLLYTPEPVNDMFRFNGGAGEMAEADVEAMGDGVLEEIPLTYHAVRPWDIQEMCEHVEKREKALEEKISHDRARGLPVKQLHDPRDNELLVDDDFALTDVDFHDHLIFRRDMPSLALLRDPLYTEIGLEHPETRAARRKERHLHAVFDEAANMNRTMSMLGGGETQLMTQGSVGGGAAVPYADYASKVRASFQAAAAYDVKFNALLADVAEKVLFVNAGINVVETQLQTQTQNGAALKQTQMNPAVRQLAMVFLKLAPTATDKSADAAAIHPVITVARKVLEQVAGGTPSKMIDASAIVEDAGVAAGDVAAVERWATAYAAVLDSDFLPTEYKRRAANAVSKEKLMALGTAFAAAQQHEFEENNRRVNLAHPSAAGVFPTQVLPILPLDAPDAVDVPTVPQPGGIAALTFRGITPQAGVAPPMVVGGGDLLLPVGDDATMPTYKSSTTQFEPYLDNPCNNSSFVAVFDDDAVRLKRVPRAAEYRRKVEANPRVAKQYVVAWDEEDAMPPPADV